MATKDTATQEVARMWSAVLGTEITESDVLAVLVERKRHAPIAKEEKDGTESITGVTGELRRRSFR